MPILNIACFPAIFFQFDRKKCLQESQISVIAGALRMFAFVSQHTRIIKNWSGSSNQTK
jgi:hypothetical protein